MPQRTRWLALPILILVLVLAFFVISERAKNPIPPRPLFHNEYTATEMSREIWFPDYPLNDDRGTLVYYDRHLNFLVILVTNDPNVPWPQPRSDTKQATLGSGTACEITVRRSSDRLILRFEHDETPIELPLPRAQGSDLIHKLGTLRSRPKPNNFDVLAVLLTTYDLPEDTRFRIAEILRKPR